jgi:hypothetical protein
MNPLVASLLQALAGPLEDFAVKAATGVNPALGAVVTIGEAVLNEKVPGLVPSAPVAGAAPAVVAAPTAAPVVVAATVGVTKTVPGIQPVAPAADTHPLIVETGRAPLTATAHPTGTVPAEDDMSFPDIYDRLAAVELNSTHW